MPFYHVNVGVVRDADWDIFDSHKPSLSFLKISAEVIG